LRAAVEIRPNICINAGGKHKQCKTFCGNDANESCKSLLQGANNNNNNKQDAQIPNPPQTPPQPWAKLEDQPCFAQCRDKCVATLTTQTGEQCIKECLITTLSDEPA
jgi:hypothetical protein